MLNVKKKIFVPVYHFYENDIYFGTLKASFIYPKALLITEKGNFSFYREKWLQGQFLCKLNSQIIAVAEKPNGIGDSYLINYNQSYFTLKPGPLFYSKAKQNYEIFDNDTQIGSIHSNSNNRSLHIDMKTELSTVIQCFTFWLSGLCCHSRVSVIGYNSTC